MGLTNKTDLASGKAQAELELSSGALTQNAADRLAAVTARAAQASCALIHLFDGQHLRLIGGHGIPPGFEQQQSAPASSTLAWLVVHSGFPVVISDTHTDVRVPIDAPVRSTNLRSYAGFPVRDPDGHIVGVCAVMAGHTRDWLPEQLTGVDDAAQACTAFVAEHLSREREHHQRVFLDTLLDSLDTGVAACDADGQMVLVNRSLHERLGTHTVAGTAEDWAARLPITDTDGTPVPAEHTSLLRALDGTPVRNAQHILHLNGQRRLFRINGHPITSDHGEHLGAVSVFHDITAAHEADRLQQLLNRTKDDYLNLVGHELRTPVSIIVSYLDLLADTDPDTPAAQLQPMIAAAQRGSQRLHRLIEQLLDLSALDAGRSPLHMAHIELSAVVADATRQFTARAQDKNITLISHLPPHLPQHADHARMRQLVTLLLDNAIAYTANGGTVTVTLSSTDTATELTVTDTGYGIPAHERPHVFERFFRGAIATELAIPGTGLGLTIAQLICERHHGSITVTPSTQHHRGTTARVLLPH
ncbi:ATP-binding protein [Actinoplanes sp. N902-109]|uniref:ATP-binding protein n=1 Tax=Actinoplanes sp. (strain N902-109) TaxID=649831 RepID=UPI0003293A25|nr:ATP-binding protein [Actinoplanes sp. N902-109]AGL15140.1 sensory histidine protein kinase [Actinoplanes sp. N902-109]